MALRRRVVGDGAALPGQITHTLHRQYDPLSRRYDVDHDANFCGFVGGGRAARGQSRRDNRYEHDVSQDGPDLFAPVCLAMVQVLLAQPCW